MKKLLTLFFATILGCFLFAPDAEAQTTKTVGGTGANYATLKVAFDAINAGTITGAITLQITGNTTETASASLNASGSGSAVYSSITIYPTATGKTISGNLATPLINLNGSDNVTIDGRVNATGSVKDLTISNTSTSNTSGTSAIRLINSAQNNIIRYCQLKSAETNAAGAVIFFSTSSSGAGNDGNTIDNNNITGNSAGRPRNGIYSIGSSGRENSGNIISNNNIFDFIKAANNSYGINLESYSTQWNITGNSFYESTVFAPVSFSAAVFGGIRIVNPTGSGFNIENNFIGGSENMCGGNPFIVNLTSATLFYGIYINVSTTTVSSIQQNTIQNFQWKTWGSTPWYGIYVITGKVDIGTIAGNMLGSATGTGSVTIENTNENCISYGLYIDGTGQVNVHNNAIGSFTIINLTSKSHDFYAIYRKGGGSTTILNNLIGSFTTPNSINLSATSGNPQSAYGIYNAASGTINLSNNTISNLTNAFAGTSTNTQTAGIITTAGTNTISNNTITNISTASPQSNYSVTASIVGISQRSTAAGQTITGNSISNLINTNTVSTFEGGVIGLYYNGPGSGSNNISNNYIFNLSVSSNSVSSRIYGMQIAAGSSTFFNNIISLGNGITSGNYIFGISDDGSNANNLYFNTVYIAGNSPGTTSPTFAMISTNNNTRNYRNNVFSNARSGGAAGSHYAICLNSKTNLTINYNDYYVSGVGGVLGGDGTIWYRENKTTLAEWKTFTAQDANSLGVDPAFAAPGGTLATGFIPSTILAGLSIGTILTDYAGNTRAVPPSMGALERMMINKWKGTLSTDWNTAANWTGNVIPAIDADITFDDAPVNNCLLDQNRSVTSIINAQSAYRMVTNGFKLTIKGTLNFTNGAQIDASAVNSTLEFAGNTPQTIPAGALYNNEVYIISVNNVTNVTLNGTLKLLNIILAASGRLDAFAASPSVIYGGTTQQIINSEQFIDDKVFNLTIDNSSGVILNANFAVSNNLVINTGKMFSIASGKTLNVGGTIDNAAGNAGFVLSSDVNGTAALLHNTNNVPATVQRYISGAVEAWHFLSTPVSGQNIGANQGASDSWLPSGTYGNGTGYDLYVWNEPTNCWIYKLNTTTPVNWNTVHPGTDFMAGRGYLYSLQAANPTKTFTGNLNNGAVTYALTSAGADLNLKGFILVGNPYPSSIDWCAPAGWTRTSLVNAGGGYDMWIWNPHANNYGVYNSTDGDGIGTNSAQRYLAPMQGYFVRAANAGNLGMANEIRVPDSANWFKNTLPDENRISLCVKSDAGYGFDEIRLDFGYPVNENGALKLFSAVLSAPGLYMTNQSEKLSVRYFTTTDHNPVVPVSFTPGVDGDFTITGVFDQTRFTTVMLEDRKTQYIHNLSASNTHHFTASTTDDADRFILYTGPDKNHPYNNLPGRIYTDGSHLIIDLVLVPEETDAFVYDLTGRLLLQKTLQGEIRHILPFNAEAQLLVVHLKNSSGKLCRKLLWGMNNH